MIPNPCCCSCTLSSDTFSSTLDPKWTTVSGTWAVSSNRLLGSGAGMIYDSTAHPGGTEANYILTHEFQFKAASGDNTFRTLVSYQDASNHLYAQVTRPATGCRQLQLGKVVAGVDTPLGEPVALVTTMNLDTTFTLTVCYVYDSSDSQLRAYITTSSGLAGNTVNVVGPGDKIGFEVIDGDIGFDAVTFSRLAIDATNPTCPACIGTCNIATLSLSGTVDTCMWQSDRGSWGADYAATGDSILRLNRPHPLGKTTMRAVAAGAGINVGEVMRVFVNYLDDDNTHFAELEFTSTTSHRVAVGKRVAGVDTILDERINITGTLTFPRTASVYACFDGTGIGGATGNPGTDLGNIGSSASSVSTEIAGGAYAAIGSSGGMNFTSFTLDKHLSTVSPAEPTCPQCPNTCYCFATTLARDGYIVDLGLGGWTANPAAVCADVKGEYILGDIFDGDNICETDYYELAFYSHVGGSCATCAADMDLGIFLRIRSTDGTPAGMIWEVIVRIAYFPFQHPSCPGACRDGMQVVYQAPLTQSTCHVTPVTLTKVSESGTYPCSVGMPNTITIDEA
jgi:hypothetical protein